MPQDQWKNEWEENFLKMYVVKVMLSEERKKSDYSEEEEKKKER